MSKSDMDDTGRGHNPVSIQKQVDASHYDFAAYMDKARWQSIWHQLDEVLTSTAGTVLEVGKGSGVLGALLRHYGLTYAAIDVDPDLRPDYVGSVTDLPFSDDEFDVVCCFQVLEHIPFALFPKALSEIRRVSSGKVIVSLPDARTLWHFSVHVPKVGSRGFYVPRPRLRPKEHVFDGEHYWEINKQGYPLKRIISEFIGAGLSIERSYRVDGNPYHRFFVASKVRK